MMVRRMPSGLRDCSGSWQIQMMMVMIDLVLAVADETSVLRQERSLGLATHGLPSGVVSLANGSVRRLKPRLRGQEM